VKTTNRSDIPNPTAREQEVDHEEHPPRLDLSARNLVGFAIFVVLAIVALYFLLPQVAGLEETWHRLEDGSPACRGSALLSLELLSREHPRSVNSVRPLLHSLANADDNEAVRRLAILALRNGSPQRDTIVLLQGIAEEDGLSQETRQTAAKVAAGLDKRAKTR